MTRSVIAAKLRPAFKGQMTRIISKLLADDNQSCVIVKLISVYCLFCFLIFFLSGCGLATHDSQIQDAFKISVATGGGFTGLVRGFYLHADGKVEAWRRFPAQPDSILWTVQADPGKIAEFVQQLEKTSELKKVHEETGNITTRIIYSLSDTSYTWSWSNAVGAPLGLKEWYAQVWQFCRALGEQQQSGGAL